MKINSKKRIAQARKYSESSVIFTEEQQTSLTKYRQELAPLNEKMNGFFATCDSQKEINGGICTCVDQDGYDEVLATMSNLIGMINNICREKDERKKFIYEKMLNELNEVAAAKARYNGAIKYLTPTGRHY